MRFLPGNNGVQKKLYRFLLLTIIGVVFILKLHSSQHIVYPIEHEFQFKRTHENKVYVGKPFKSDLNKYLAKLNLLNVPYTTSDRRILESDPVFVSGLSSSYVENCRTMLRLLKKQFNNTKKIIIYDLGLNKAERISFLTENSHVLYELKTFPFQDYPDFVKSHLEYFHWKPLIIAEMLNEFPSIWWFDTTVQLHGPVNEIYSEFKFCSWDRSQCSYTSWIFVDHGGHSIYATTHAKMYEYFPIPLSKAKELNMVSAGIQLIYGLKDLKETVLRFWVLCALEPECLAPSGALFSCGSGDRYNSYLGCHRYDQSALNILIAWKNGFKELRYRLYPNTVFKIVQ